MGVHDYYQIISFFPGLFEKSGCDLFFRKMDECGCAEEFRIEMRFFIRMFFPVVGDFWSSLFFHKVVNV